MNQFNLKNEKILQCNVIILNLINNYFLFNSVKGTIERIDENDDQRKRISERASAQARPLSDKVNIIFTKYTFYIKFDVL